MVNQPEDTFASEPKRDHTTYVDGTVNSSNIRQESIVVEDADVRPNDHKVLETLGEDKSRYTFKGLMRKLGMHQESSVAQSYRILTQEFLQCLKGCEITL